MKFLYILFFSIFLCSCASIPNEQYNSTAAEYNVSLGFGYFRERQIDRAREKFLRALTQDPNSSEVQLAMGYFLLQLKQFDQAKPYYMKALKLAPNSPAVLNNYGAYLCETGKYQVAIKYFLDAANNPQYLHPDAAYENAGLCALKIPDKKKASNYFRKALQFNPLRKRSLLEISRLKRYHLRHGNGSPHTI